MEREHPKVNGPLPAFWQSRISGFDDSPPRLEAVLMSQNGIHGASEKLCGNARFFERASGGAKRLAFHTEINHAIQFGSEIRRFSSSGAGVVAILIHALQSSN